MLLGLIFFFPQPLYPFLDWLLVLLSAVTDVSEGPEWTKEHSRVLYRNLKVEKGNTKPKLEMSLCC